MIGRFAFANFSLLSMEQKSHHSAALCSANRPLRKLFFYKPKQAMLFVIRSCCEEKLVVIDR
jgi:hypothetical protein